MNVFHNLEQKKSYSKVISILLEKNKGDFYSMEESTTNEKCLMILVLCLLCIVKSQLKKGMVDYLEYCFNN